MHGFGLKEPSVGGGCGCAAVLKCKKKSAETKKSASPILLVF
jgi:hypothetical protein